MWRREWAEETEAALLSGDLNTCSQFSPRHSWAAYFLSQTREEALAVKASKGRVAL